MTKLTSLCAALALVSTAACKKKEAAPAAASTPAPAAPVAAAAAAAPAAPAPPPPVAPSTVKVDPEIQKRVDAIVANCEIDPAYMSVNSCKNNEDYAIIDYAANARSMTAFESLAEIAVTAKDPKVKAAVIGTWNTFSDRALEQGNATAAAASRVLALYPQVPGDADRFAYAAPIPLIAGQRAQLTAVLSKLPASRLKDASIQWYLDAGGTAALPDVQAFYTGATTDGQRAAALWSVGIAVYNQVADADKAAMCDWTKAVAADPATTTSALASATSSLGRCKGAYIDGALAALAGRIAKEHVTETTANALQHMCWSEGVVGGAVNATPAQCAQTLAILDKAVSDKDAAAPAVRQALWVVEMIGKYGDGQREPAKALLTRFKNNADKAVADQAVSSLKALS